MYRLILLSLAIIIGIGLKAQTPQALGFIAHSLTTKSLGTVEFYVADTLHQQQKPMLVFLDGSGSRPLYFYQANEEGTYQFFSSMPFNMKEVASQFHLVMISKPGIQLVDTIAPGPDLTTDSVYSHYASADWRVEATSLVIDYVAKHYPVDKSKIALLGYSEGAQVAPRVAVRNKKVTHCIAFVGGGLNQFFDEIIKLRTAAVTGQMTHDEAQQQIDTLMTIYADVYANPKATDKRWYGHTYLRWASFTSVPTMEYFKKLDIPLYIVQGTADRNTEILSADYVQLEFLRLGKTNLTYKPCPGYSHFFTHTATGENRLHQFISEAIDWVKSTP